MKLPFQIFSIDEKIGQNDEIFFATKLSFKMKDPDNGAISSKIVNFTAQELPESWKPGETVKFDLNKYAIRRITKDDRSFLIIEPRLGEEA